MNLCKSGFHKVWGPYLVTFLNQTPIFESYNVEGGKGKKGLVVNWGPLHTRDHCLLRSLIGQQGWIHPSSLHTRRCRPKSLNKIVMDEKPIWFLTCQIIHIERFHGMLEFVSYPPPRGRPGADSSKPCQFLQKWLSHLSWYGLCMRVKGPHNYMVTTLGSCVKWSWVEAKAWILSALPPWSSPVIKEIFGHNQLRS